MILVQLLLIGCVYAAPQEAPSSIVATGPSQPMTAANWAQTTSQFVNFVSSAVNSFFSAFPNLLSMFANAGSPAAGAPGTQQGNAQGGRPALPNLNFPGMPQLPSLSLTGSPNPLNPANPKQTDPMKIRDVELFEEVSDASDNEVSDAFNKTLR